MTATDHICSTQLGLRHAGRAFWALAFATILGFGMVASPASAQGADTVFRVQQLQEEVRELRGQVEQQAAEIERLKQQQRDQYLDLDSRINELADGAAPVVNETDDGPESVDDEASSEDVDPTNPVDAPVVQEQDSEPVAVTTVETPDTVVEEPENSGSLGAKAQYDEAFQHLRDLRYAQAAEAFSDFLDDHPDSEFADNAQYWLGESYYVTGNYDLALDAFDRLLDDFPSSPKTADALLKIGYTQYELENWSQARTALEAVKSRYPDTTLARLADNRLRAMRLEGHF